MTAEIMPVEHVPITRLKEVGIKDVLFTSEETNHLKECAECFDDWLAVIKAQADTDPEAPADSN